MAFSTDATNLIEVYTRKSKIEFREKHNISDELRKKIDEFYFSLYKLYAKGDHEEIGRFYDVWAANGGYDEVMIAVQPPLDIIMSKLYESFDGDVSKKSIIDIGAGTGLMGNVLHKAGFGNVDGVDLSKGMLAAARAKGAYNQLFCREILPDQPIDEIATDTYDGAVSSSCFTPGHVPMAAVSELCRIVKPGGFLCYTVRDPELTLNWMQHHAKIMEERKAVLISIQKAHYKWDAVHEYESAQCHIVHMQVL